MERKGFSLIELLAATAVSVLLLVLLFGVLQQVSRTAKRASATSTAFDDARIAFGEMQALLGQATLSPFWRVNYDGSGNPTAYVRHSDLHFLMGKADELLPSARPTSGSAIFFQSPIGFDPFRSTRDSALNALGFFVEYRDANLDMPVAGTGQPPRWRFQLRAFKQSASDLNVFDATDSSGRLWFQEPYAAADAPITTLAENILLFLVRARTIDGGTEQAFYYFDSRSWDGEGNQPETSHQLPALLDVMMIACDEATAERVAGSGTRPEFPSGLFDDPEEFANDTSYLETWLGNQYPSGVFRVFRATIPIRAAKWSIDSDTT